MLDFPALPEWHSAMIESIKPLDSEDPLAVGNTLHAVINGGGYDLLIKVPPLLTAPRSS
jgi:hypothetical protein